MATTLVADTFSTDLNALPANVTLRDAGLFSGAIRLPTSTAQGYADFAFVGFNVAQAFVFESDVRLGRGPGPVPDGISEITANFGNQLGVGFGGADFNGTAPPMLLVFSPIDSLQAFTPTPFVFGDGKFHHLSVAYDGVSQVNVSFSEGGTVFSQTLNHTFSPTADFTLTMRGVNGMGGYSEVDNLSFSSDGLVVVPEPSVLSLAASGLVSMAAVSWRRNKKQGTEM